MLPLPIAPFSTPAESEIADFEFSLREAIHSCKKKTLIKTVFI